MVRISYRICTNSRYNVESLGESRHIRTLAAAELRPTEKAHRLGLSPMLVGLPQLEAAVGIEPTYGALQASDIGLFAAFLACRRTRIVPARKARLVRVQ